MPLDPVRIAIEVSRGLSMVCATCENYWVVHDRGADRCQMVGCGSPLAGDVFHLYRGPLADGGFAKYCFVCGGVPKHQLRVGRKSRLIGVCQQHVQMFNQLQPVGKEAPSLTSEILLAEAQDPVSGLFRPSGKKTLAAAIQEVEDYYEQKEGAGS